jgi:hypothetical protein
MRKRASFERGALGCTFIDIDKRTTSNYAITEWTFVAGENIYKATGYTSTSRGNRETFTIVADMDGRAIAEYDTANIYRVLNRFVRELESNPAGV